MTHTRSLPSGTLPPIGFIPRKEGLVKKVFEYAAMAIGAGVLLLCVLTVVMLVLDPAGMKAAIKENEAAAAKRKAEKAGEDEGSKRIVQHGFTTGYTMAKLGAVKPSADQVDALARKAANELGDNGGLGFKMQWRNAFWNGWNKGD